MGFNVEERGRIVAIYYKNIDYARAEARIFNERHPGKNMSHIPIRDILPKFVATGSVHNKKGSSSKILKMSIQRIFTTDCRQSKARAEIQ